ncbi:AhpC/TSA family protein [Hymenobacter sp. 15J16-1T3B]|uniref:TlpA disulfide reductase family protein n=1 Tax=Hymenobacter sp. 15J16-1T3B TaxID=2886941 RepID=UPI001D110E22|nr:TlpA disulfide reductase family protein [Hymenobacter sp. 15J16-1T3B]MCC3158985.1 AhpC/TSA family protein [Hymenobacter sp. 15J16-1T3B]
MSAIRLAALVLLGLPSVPALAQQPGAAPNYEVRGLLRQAPAGTRVVLTRHSGGQTVLDSAITDAAGRFRLRGSVPAPDVYVLRVRGQQPTTTLALAPGSRLQLRAEAAQLWRTGEVTGSAEAAALSAMNREHARLMARIEALAQQRGQTADTAAQRRMQRDWDATMAAFGASSRRVARSSTYLAPYVVATFLSSAGADMAFVDSATTRYAQQWPASPYTKNLLKYQAIRRATAVGQPAPAVVLADPTGQRRALSSLRGQYVLLDFWASWCGPCRQENAHLVQLYRQFHPKGFEVYSVSTDRKQADWLKAIEQDGLTWTQVLDEPGEQSVAANGYDIVEYPTTFLLDREGRIIAKNLRGEALAKKLAELMP